MGAREDHAALTARLQCPDCPTAVIDAKPPRQPFKQSPVSRGGLEVERRALAFLSTNVQARTGAAPIDTLFIEGQRAETKRLGVGALGTALPFTRNIVLSDLIPRVERLTGGSRLVEDITLHEQGHNFVKQRFGENAPSSTERLFPQFLEETGLPTGADNPYSFGDPRYAARGPHEFEAEIWRGATRMLSSPNEGRVKKVRDELRKDPSAQAQATTIMADDIQRAENAPESHNFPLGKISRTLLRIPLLDRLSKVKTKLVRSQEE